MNSIFYGFAKTSLTDSEKKTSLKKRYLACGVLFYEC